MIVEVKNKSQLDNKIGVNSEAEDNLGRNRTSAFSLKLLAGQILLLLPHGASRTAHLRRVCKSIVFVFNVFFYCYYQNKIKKTKNKKTTYMVLQQTSD